MNDEVFPNANRERFQLQEIRFSGSALNPKGIEARSSDLHGEYLALIDSFDEPKR
jgi:hypothetical protein